MKGFALEDAVVRTTGLCKAYRTGADAAPVLRGIDLDVRRGECVYLVGPSGSGKTTLLSILGCVLSADAGSLEILGEDALRFSNRERARFRREEIGFVFQRYHLFDALTAVRENNAASRSTFALAVEPARARSLELLSLVGLAEKASSPVTQLSMGQRQRVAFARALSGNPRLILADEPTASLDAESGGSAMRVLKELCRELGKTVVVVTHDSRIYPLADRVLSLGDGRIVGEEATFPCDAAAGPRPGAWRAA